MSAGSVIVVLWALLVVLEWLRWRSAERFAKRLDEIRTMLDKRSPERGDP